MKKPEYEKNSHDQEMALQNIFWKMHFFILCSQKTILWFILCFFFLILSCYSGRWKSFQVTKILSTSKHNNSKERWRWCGCGGSKHLDFCNQRNLLPINSAYFVIWKCHFSIYPKMKRFLDRTDINLENKIKILVELKALEMFCRFF